MVALQDTERRISSGSNMCCDNWSTSSWEILTPSSSEMLHVRSQSPLDLHLIQNNAAFDSSSDWDSESQLSTPGSGSLSLDSLSLLQDCFICPLCPASSKRFKTARALEQHQTSLVHLPKVFHCPALAGGARCKSGNKSFCALSGLAMHVESGACGMKMLKEVIGLVNGRLGAIGLGQMCLLG